MEEKGNDTFTLGREIKNVRRAESKWLRISREERERIVDDINYWERGRDDKISPDTLISNCRCCVIFQDRDPPEIFFGEGNERGATLGGKESAHTRLYELHKKHKLEAVISGVVAEVDGFFGARVLLMDRSWSSLFRIKEEELEEMNLARSEEMTPAEIEKEEKLRRINFATNLASKGFLTIDPDDKCVREK